MDDEGSIDGTSWLVDGDAGFGRAATMKKADFAHDGRRRGGWEWWRSWGWTI